MGIYSKYGLSLPYDHSGQLIFLAKKEIKNRYRLIIFFDSFNMSGMKQIDLIDFDYTPWKKKIRDTDRTKIIFFGAKGLINFIPKDGMVQKIE